MKIYFIFLCLIISSGIASATTQTPLNQDKPPRLYVKTYFEANTSSSFYLETEGDSWWMSLLKESDGGNWVEGGNWVGDFSGSWRGRIEAAYPNSIDNDDPNGNYLWVSDEVIYSNPPWTCYEISGIWNDMYTDTNSYYYYPPPVAWEHCDTSVPLVDSSGTGIIYVFADGTLWIGTATATETRVAQATMKLQTGGKANSKLRNLFGLSCNATRYDPLHMSLSDSDRWLGYEGPTAMNMGLYYSHVLPDRYGPIATSIPSQNIILGSCGALGADGVKYLALPDNADVDVTPYVAGVDYYTWNISQQKYKLNIAARGNGTNYDLSTDKPEFCAGQSLTFAPSWSPSTPPYTNSVQHWTLPDKYVNEAYPYSTYCTSYRKNTDLLTNRVNQCWYVNGSGGTASIRMNLKFSNGQTASVAAMGDFSILRPYITRVATNGTPGAAIDTSGTFPLLWLDGGPMDFKVYISETFPGKFGISQLVNLYSETIILPPDVLIFSSTYGNYWLDGNHEFYELQTPVSLAVYPSNTEYSSPSAIFDTPGQSLVLYIGSYNGSWQDYVRFTPQGDGSIPITLGRVDWSWAATAIVTAPLTWAVSSDGVNGPARNNDDSFPVWSNVYPSSE